MLSTISHFLAGHAVAALMLSVGLQTDRTIFHDLSTRWKVLARALAVVWIGVPLLALLAVTVFRPGVAGMATLLVVAICPGVPLVLRKSRKAHGDPDLSLLVLIATALTAIVMVPLWATVLARITPFELAISPIAVAGVLLPTVLIPFVIGRIVNRLSPRVAAPLARFFSIVFVVGIAIVIVPVLIKGIPILRQLTLRGLAAVVFVALGAATMGYLAGRRREERISLGYAAALGNPALALAVAAYSFPNANALALVAAYVLLRVVALLPFQLWLKRKGAGGKSTPLPHDPGLAHARGN